jgi:hypothetical protein
MYTAAQACVKAKGCPDRCGEWYSYDRQNKAFVATRANPTGFSLGFSLSMTNAATAERRQYVLPNLLACTSG